MLPVFGLLVDVVAMATIDDPSIFDGPRYKTYPGMFYTSCRAARYEFRDKAARFIVWIGYAPIDVSRSFNSLSFLSWMNEYTRDDVRALLSAIATVAHVHDRGGCGCSSLNADDIRNLLNYW